MLSCINGQSWEAELFTERYTILVNFKSKTIEKSHQLSKSKDDVRLLAEKEVDFAKGLLLGSVINGATV